MNLTFLRHGTTDLNGKGFVATKLDYPLNENGRKQCLKIVFSKDSFNNVYASPYKRTIETAKLVYPYKEPILSSYIVQRDLGVLNEKHKYEFDSEYLRLVREYLINPEGAESLMDIMNRLDSFFDYVNTNNAENDNILVVTHNGIMRIVKKYYMNEQENVESKNLGGFTLKLKK